jgi:hypothetical protein
MRDLRGGHCGSKPLTPCPLLMGEGAKNIVDMTLRDVMLKLRKKGGDSMSNHCICEVAEA